MSRNLSAAVDILAVVLLAVTWALPVCAHPLAPSLLEIREVGDGKAEVKWTTPLFKVRGSEELRPLLPKHCVALDRPAVVADEARVTESWAVDCGSKGLVGHLVGVDGLRASITDALLRLDLADGRSIRVVVRPSEPVVEIPKSQSRLEVSRGYIGLGVTHILLGIDHLLFVFGLLLLMRDGRSLVKVITGFTLGHSVTLSLAALGFVHVPTRAVDVAVALSIFYLAVELVRREDRGVPSAIERQPWALTFALGMLHGLGFAGALAELGLPERDIPFALFSFNVGIEVGQIIFVSVILLQFALLRPLLVRFPAPMRWVPLYAIGSLAAFWFYERAAVLIS